MVNFQIEVMGVSDIANPVVEMYFDFFGQCFDSYNIVNDTKISREDGYVKIESSMDLNKEVVNEVLEDFAGELWELEGVLAVKFEHSEA